MDEKVKYWLEMSEYDLDTSLAMLETQRYLYVGFMCHQSVEKAFKAVLSSRTEQVPPKIHNLIRLAEQCGLLGIIPEKHKKLLFLLNPLNIESRYPTYKDEMLKLLNSSKCLEIINGTKELILWIREQL